MAAMRISVALALALAAGCKDSRPVPPREAGVAEAVPAGSTPSATPAPAPAIPATPGDDVAIRRVFADYQAAIERGDGARAAALLDSTTIAFYERMKRAALDMPGDDVRQQPLVERLTIVAMRVGKSRAQLDATRTEDLVAAAITQGTGVSSVKGVELSAITVDGDTAQATPLKAGLALPVAFAFRRESGAWRVDLTRLLERANELLRSQLKGMSEDQLIRAYVASAGGTVDEAMWDPPQ
jgi:hypothetical protein